MSLGGVQVTSSATAKKATSIAPSTVVVIEGAATALLV